MSTTTESPFSYTIKVGRNNDLLTGRADDSTQMQARIQEMHVLKSVIEGQPVAAPVVAELAAVDQAVAYLQAGGITGTVVQQEQLGGYTVQPPAPITQQSVEEITDKWGNTWTYGHPDAPALPDGRGAYARKKGISKAGSQYTGWFDPAKGPKAFPPGVTEAPPIFPKR